MDDDDPVVLRFHDSSLRLSDVHLLDGPNWLSDHFIGFFFEYLEKAVCRDAALRVAFLGPEVAQLVKLSPRHEARDLLAPLELHLADLVFVPVNDAYETENGTHWSLLLYSRTSGVFFHYDSCRGFNLEHAHTLCTHLEPALSCAEGLPLLEPACPQQSNNYDCGVHVLCNAWVMVHKLVLKDLDYHSGQKTPSKMREKLRLLIVRLAREEQYRGDW